MRQKQTVWLIATVLCAVAVVAYTFSAVVQHTGRVVPELGGDGGKNIFAYLYHVIYGKGVWFTGMNYPYGEHIVYTDGQPLLSVLLSSIKGVTIGDALGVMWGVIIVSYVLAIVFVWKILVRYAVGPMIAAVFSCLIVLLSPQIFRTFAHFGLSYTCVVPMLYYWTLLYGQTKRKRYAIYIFAMGCLASFLHPYFSGLSLVWTLAYSMGYLLFAKRPGRARIGYLVPLLLAGIGISVVFGTIMHFTDPLHDRPQTPYGIVAYCATGDDLLTSQYSYIWQFLSQHFSFIKLKEGGEGYAYLGLVTIVAVILSAGAWAIAWRRKQQTMNAHEVDMRIWLFMAVLSLLLSMGVPFVWNMEWLAGYLSVFRQFRTLGRFSWLFYYLVSIYGVVAIYGWYARYRLKGRKMFAMLILVVAIGVWSIEAAGYIHSVHEKMGDGYKNYSTITSKKEHNWSQYLKERGHKPDDFQAILLLRFFEVGMDKLWLGRDVTNIGISAGVDACLQLHIPMVDAMMARSSWSITKKQVKIAAGPYVHKPMLDDLKSNKPFLLLQVDYDQLDADQKYLLEASDSIGHYLNWNVYACYPERIKANDKRYADSIRRILPYMQKQDTCVGCNGTWYVNHLDDHHAPETFFGAGAVPQIIQHDTELMTIPVMPTRDQQPYELSCWVLLGDENYRSPYFKLELLDAQSNIVYTTDMLTKESTDNHGLWFRSFLHFNIPMVCRAVRVRLFNDPDKTYKALDELMLRPDDALIISKDQSGKVMVNNHLIEK